MTTVEDRERYDGYAPLHAKVGYSRVEFMRDSSLKLVSTNRPFVSSTRRQNTSTHSQSSSKL